MEQISKMQVKELEETLSLARNENDILSIKKEELLKELSEQVCTFLCCWKIVIIELVSKIL